MVTATAQATIVAMVRIAVTTLGQVPHCSALALALDETAAVQPRCPQHSAPELPAALTLTRRIGETA
ncbi:MAG: hypothetical protein DLM60_08860 [Pseudonocardiales bacterium]|nr:MAG: hypothetical protein DLM60_08860 [Pseudonocardiales bacterium]